MMHNRVLPGILFVLGILVASAPASADETLLNRGVEQMKAGRFDVACPLIAASQRINPTPETLYTLAECESRRGQIARALGHYRQYLQSVMGMPGAQRQQHEARAKNAEAQVATLEPEVPTLKLVLPSYAPFGIQVTRNGLPVDSASFGIDVLVDPGEHVVVTRLPDGATFEQRIVLKIRDRKTLDVQIPPDAVKPEPLPPESDAAGTLARPWQRPVGIAVMAIGVPAVAVGFVLGAAAISKRNESNRFGHCDAQDSCDTEGLDLRKEAVGLADASTTAIVVGSVFLAGGIVLFATAPRGAKPERRAKIGFFKAHVDAGLAEYG